MQWQFWAGYNTIGWCDCSSEWAARLFDAGFPVRLISLGLKMIDS